MTPIRLALVLLSLSACGGGVQPFPDGGYPADSGLPALPDGGVAHCDAVPVADGLTLHVNPVEGDDFQGTGSATAAGATQPACAYRTLTRALALATAAAKPSMHVVVDVTGFLGSGEALPLALPAGTSLEAAAGATPRLTVSSGTGLLLARPGASVSGLVLDGAGSGSVGVLASAASLSLTGVELTGFTTVGLRAEKTAAVVVAGSSRLHHNALGLLAVDAALVTLDATLATLTAPLEVSDNAGNGLEVSGAAHLVASGYRSDLDPAQGTLLLSGNARHGVHLQQALVAEGTAGPAASSLTGVVARGNGASGLHLMGGSAVAVRGSYLSDNRAHGVHVQTDPAFVSGGAGANTGNLISRLDLGAAGDPGANLLQDPGHPNTRKGVCLALTSGGSTGGMLKVAGNRFASGASLVDCAQLAASLPATRDCEAEGPLGDLTGNPKNDFDLGLCVVP
jgi:hypothetical protein